MTDDNADQAAYWNGDPGKRWRTMADETDMVFAPMALAAVDRALLRAGERVLDVGCGCGATTLLLAERVQPDGTVTGIDLSQPMLDLARDRAQSARCENATFILGDASAMALPRGSFDVLFSQFGVMFFADPIATFARLRAALATGGRLLFRCWQRPEDNAFFGLPGGIARRHVPRAATPVPGAPGPLAFADPAHVRDVLAQAGFREIVIDAEQTPLSLGSDARAAVAFASRIGSAARVLEEATPDERDAASAAIHAAFAREASAAGVVVNAGTWIVRARSE